MNPRLNNFRIRGGTQKYLKHIYTGREYEIDSLQTQILWHCDGQKSREEILTLLRCIPEEFHAFLNDAIEQDILVEDNQMQTHPPLGRAPYLKEVHFDASGYCNLFGICKHCFGTETFKNAARTQLSTAEALSLFDEMEAMNVAACVLSGGEIFMRKDLPILIYGLRERALMLSSLFTNATLWREDVAEAMENTKFKNNWLISLDGHTAAINDFYRGKGSFVKTVRFIKKLVAKGHKIAINTVLMKDNIGFMDEMREFFQELGVNRWRCSIPREQGEARKNHDLIMPTWETVFEVYERNVRWLLEHWRKGMMKIQIGSIFRTDFIEDPFYYLFSPDHACCEYKRNFITVKPNGEVTHCTAFDNLPLGNIRDEPLQTIWRKRKTQLMKTLPIKETECYGCPWEGYCGTGCRKIAYDLHQSLFAKDTSVCPLYEFVGKKIIPLLAAYGIKERQMTKKHPHFRDYSLLKKVCSVSAQNP